jgi:gamma-glutamylcyclotransferase (GGCT)/AIG2-like uncharacterized protein YtfP
MKLINLKTGNSRTLFQNNNVLYYTLVDENGNAIGNTNIVCKDYFNEIFAYLLEGLYENLTLYGLHIDKYVYEQHKNKDRYYLNIRPVKGEYPNLLEVTQEVISELNEGLEVEEASKGIVLMMPKDFVKYPFKISYITGKIRAHFTKELDKYPIEKYNLLNTLKEECNLGHNKDKSIDSSHNYSGFFSSFSNLTDNIAIVYGTLRKGFGNHNRLLSDSIYISTFEMPRNLYMGHTLKMYDMGFPCLVIERLEYGQKAEGTIVVETYYVTDETKKRLDYLEGYSESNPKNSMYIRVKNHLGFIYLYNSSTQGLKEIVSGDYKSYMDEKRKAFSTTN